MPPMQMLWCYIKPIWWSLLAVVKYLYQKLSHNQKNFILLSSGRSGSTLLVQYLNSHYLIKCHGELLNRDDLLSHSLDWKASNRTLINYIMAQLLSINSLENFIGFKLFNEQLEYCNLSLMDLLKSLGSPSVIVLYRENLLETYTSLKIAQMNDVWFSAETANDCSIEIDWELLKDYCECERERWRRSLSCVDGCQFIVLSYEELIKDKERTMSTVFEFLNLPVEEVVAYSARQNPSSLEKKVTNYREIMRRAEDENISLMLTHDWMIEHIHH
jgi:LPS sulfotransferase NodH